MAALDTDNNQVVIATDSLAVWDEFQKDLGHKFIEYYAYGVTVAYAGSTRFAQIAEKLIRDNKYFKDTFNATQVKLLASDMQTHLKDEPISDDGQLLFVCKGSTAIYELDTDLAVNKHKKWASIGSGGTFGECVLTALFDLDVNITVKERVHSAMKSVCTHLTSCGGKIHIKEV
jgi:ATP-dependent protease HslVU (ClpYQ) peptidase subunit